MALTHDFLVAYPEKTLTFRFYVRSDHNLYARCFIYRSPDVCMQPGRSGRLDRRHSTQSLLRILGIILTPHRRLRVPHARGIILTLDGQLLLVIPVKACLPVRIVGVRFVHVRASALGHRRQGLQCRGPVLRDVGAIIDHLLEGRAVIVSFADDDVDDVVPPGGEDAVVGDGVRGFEVRVHDGFDHGGAVVEEGFEGLREVLLFGLDDVAWDEPVRPLERAGSQGRKETFVGGVEGRVVG